MLEQRLNRPEDAFVLGRDLSDEEFSDSLKNISKAIAESPFYCAYAGMIWPLERALQISEYLARGVMKDPQFCYEAGLCWDDLLFDSTNDLILQGLRYSPIYQLKSLKDWNPERVEKIKDLLPDNILRFYESLERYQDEFVEFAENLGLDNLMKLSLEDFYKSVHAYNLMCAYDRSVDDATVTGNIQRKAEVKGLFFRNLLGAIDHDHVLEFAQDFSAIFKSNRLRRYGLTETSLN